MLLEGTEFYLSRCLESENKRQSQKEEVKHIELICIANKRIYFTYGLDHSFGEQPLEIHLLFLKDLEKQL